MECENITIKTIEMSDLRCEVSIISFVYFKLEFQTMTIYLCTKYEVTENYFHY